MSVHYSESQTIAAVARLTRTRLTTFVQAEIVTPIQTETGPAFRQLDLARLELLCELSDDFDIDEDALGMIMTLLDQLHRARLDLRSVLSVIEGEADDLRHRVAAALQDPTGDF